MMARAGGPDATSAHPLDFRSTRSQGPGAAVRGLTVCFPTASGERAAVDGVDLELPAGEITGLVGESGSGKSTLALALVNAVPPPGRITSGSVQLPGVPNLLELSGRALRRARGRAAGYVFQASQNSLNPLKRVGAQLLDLARSHDVPEPRSVLRTARGLCERMGMDPVRVLASYEHELSGGMRQRVGIIFALVLNASVLILDEPTTALDMLSQASVLEIVRDVHRERKLVTLLITHDVGVVAELADRLVVMYGGRVVEQGATATLLRSPCHPYTEGLVRAMPRITGPIDTARPLPGRAPDLGSLPLAGCAFRERCALQIVRCASDRPRLEAASREPADDLEEPGDPTASRTAPAAHLAACHVRSARSTRESSRFSDAGRGSPVGSRGREGDR